MSVDPAYQHRPKRATPGDAIRAGGTELKWYQLAPASEPIAPDTIAAARAFVVAEGEGERLGIADDHGFVILHRCGESFYFLLVSVWRGSNELWEAVYYRDAAMADFARFDPAYPDRQMLRPTFCVWELGIVAFEAEAWQRFLSSPRADEDVAMWRSAHCDGEV